MISYDGIYPTVRIIYMTNKLISSFVSDAFMWSVNLYSNCPDSYEWFNLEILMKLIIWMFRELWELFTMQLVRYKLSLFISFELSKLQNFLSVL